MTLKPLLCVKTADRSRAINFDSTYLLDTGFIQWIALSLFWTTQWGQGPVSQKSPETFRVYFGCHNILYTFAMKLRNPLGFSYTNEILKGQLFQISWSKFEKWLFGTIVKQAPGRRFYRMFRPVISSNSALISDPWNEVINEWMEGSLLDFLGTLKLSFKAADELSFKSKLFISMPFSKWTNW